MSQPEKQAFAKLFASLSKKPRPAPAVENAPAEHTLDEFEKGEQISENATLLDRLLQEVAQTENDQIAKYPPTLRAMATRVQLQVAAEQAKTLQRQESMQRDTEPEYIELRTIETALHSAATDVELWGILEESVFPSMRRIQEDSEFNEVNAEKTDQPEDSLVITAATERGSSNAPPPKIGEGLNIADTPRFTHYIRAYPALILLAARQATRRTAYTPMVFALLPYIKAMGFSAYVLGASTSLYNEVLRAKWRVYHDLTGMLVLLREMSKAGFSMDDTTALILDEVSRYRTRALDGEFGNGVRDIESTVGRSNDGAEIKRWKKRIQAQLEAQAIDAANRAEIERKVRLEGGFADYDAPPDASMRNETRTETDNLVRYTG